ncbi:hypothetical protein AB4851_28520 [Burkholderia sp. 22PA0099]|uniref:hypothetical protein n=1 Tax=Burkholderia sp. 22PA0099 TaxID=3237372 RepID=UPI0039C2CA40
MGKKGSESVQTLTQPVALVELSEKLADLVRTGSLDTRCAAKLLDRLEKEAAAVVDRDAASEDALKPALKALKHAIRDSDAGTFVKASAALR